MNYVEMASGASGGTGVGRRTRGSRWHAGPQPDQHPPQRSAYESGKTIFYTQRTAAMVRSARATGSQSAAPGEVLLGRPSVVVGGLEGEER